MSNECDGFVEAIGKCVDGVWNSTTDVRIRDAQQQTEKRMPGLLKDKIHISPDFDTPLSEFE